MLQIKCFKNHPIDSNCYLIFDQNFRNSIVVDPGTDQDIELNDFIELNKIKVDYIILTHEHFDHIWGVNSLRSKFPCKVICSTECGEKVVDKKKNLSLFYDNVGFQIDPPDTKIETDFYEFKWNNYNINIFKTPGHSDGSICIQVNNYLFTGDTIIKGEKTVLKLPNSNKNSLLKSLKIIESICSPDTLILSGHGDSFYFEKCHFDNCI
ncbi:MAG: MBL fold metallo-hydrolase [Tenuifilaceae bacterium]